MQQKFQKIFFDFEITVFELVVLKTRFYWERILVILCHYVKKHSKFEIQLKESSWSWFSFRVIKKYEKNTAVQI